MIGLVILFTSFGLLSIVLVHRTFYKEIKQEDSNPNFYYQECVDKCTSPSEVMSFYNNVVADNKPKSFSEVHRMSLKKLVENQ